MFKSQYIIHFEDKVKAGQEIQGSCSIISKLSVGVLDSSQYQDVALPVLQSWSRLDHVHS